MPRINRRKRARRLLMTPDEVIAMTMAPEADYSREEIAAFDAACGDSVWGRKQFEGWLRDHDAWHNRPDKSESIADRYWRQMRKEGNG